MDFLLGDALQQSKECRYVSRAHDFRDGRDVANPVSDKNELYRTFGEQKSRYPS